MNEIFVGSLVGLATTSSAIAGTAIGLYYPLSKCSLACILAFAAGAVSVAAFNLSEWNGFRQELTFVRCRGPQTLSRQRQDRDIIPGSQRSLPLAQ